MGARFGFLFPGPEKKRIYRLGRNLGVRACGFIFWGVGVGESLLILQPPKLWGRLSVQKPFGAKGPPEEDRDSPGGPPDIDGAGGPTVLVISGKGGRGAFFRGDPREGTIQPRWSTCEPPSPDWEEFGRC